MWILMVLSDLHVVFDLRVATILPVVVAAGLIF